jgi:HAD superfamily hydrolase (TIGR01509 family)
MTNVVFDVGQVLLKWDPRLVYTDHFDSDEQIDAFLAEIDFNAWNIEQDRGRTWAEAVDIGKAAHPQHADLIAKFDRDWHMSVPGAIQGTVEVLEDLREKNQPLYAITNFSAEKWAECTKRFDFLTGFRDVVVSAHEKMIKPDPAIFELFLDRNELEADDCIFIDDSPANICAAESVGFDAILFEGPVRLRNALIRRGLPL